jgi:hypothetical protein
MSDLYTDENGNYHLTLTENELILISCLVRSTKLGDDNKMCDAAFTLLSKIEANHSEFLDEASNLVGVKVELEKDDCIVLSLDLEDVYFTIYDRSGDTIDDYLEGTSDECE